jgi:hypothetical protein
MLSSAGYGIEIAHDPEKWIPVSRLREALAKPSREIEASAGEGRSGKIMRHDNFATTPSRGMTACTAFSRR